MAAMSKVLVVVGLAGLSWWGFVACAVELHRIILP